MNTDYLWTLTICKHWLLVVWPPQKTCWRQIAAGCHHVSLSPEESWWQLFEKKTLRFLCFGKSKTSPKNLQDQVWLFLSEILSKIWPKLMSGFRWRRRRGGVWLLPLVQWVSRPAPNNSTKRTTGENQFLSNPCFGGTTLCVCCGTAGAGAGWHSGQWWGSDRCGLWGQGMSPTCEMAYPPPPLLPRPEFPHFPHLAPPPTNFPSLGPTNSFSTPSGYPGLFPRLPGTFHLLSEQLFFQQRVSDKATNWIVKYYLWQIVSWWCF